MSQQLTILPGRYAVCRLLPSAALPEWAAGEFFCVIRTAEELSVVCLQEQVPGDVRHQPDWRLLKVRGPLDFSLTGVLAGLAGPLADSGISLFALSTFDTDYLLIPDQDLEAAVRVLTQAGHDVQSG